MIILVHKLVVLVVRWWSGFGLGMGYPVFGGLGRFIFLSLYCIILILVSNLSLFDFRFASHFFYFRFQPSWQHLVVRIWSNPLVSTISDKPRSSPDAKKTQIYALETLLCSEHVQVVQQSERGRRFSCGTWSLCTICLAHSFQER